MTPVEQSRLPWRRSPSFAWERLERLVPRIERAVATGARPRIGMFLDGCAIQIEITVTDDVEHDVVLRIHPDLVDGASANEPWGAGTESMARAFLGTLRRVVDAPIDDAPTADPAGDGPCRILAAVMLDEAFPDDGGVGVRAADIRMATPLGTGGVSVFETNGSCMMVDASEEFVTPGPVTLVSTVTTDIREGMRFRMVVDAPHSRIDAPVPDALGRMRLEAEAARIRKERGR